VVALVGLGYYLAPRIVGLVRIPEVLDGAIVHMRSYNPGLPETAAFDRRATAELAALDRIDAALARVRTTDATASVQLRGLVDQIRNEVQPLLGRTDVDVASLVGSLDRLTRALAGVREPLGDAATALHGGRARLTETIRIARTVAAQVRSARRSGQRSADDVSGPG
jgi:hypothetical protein